MLFNDAAFIACGGPIFSGRGVAIFLIMLAPFLLGTILAVPNLFLICIGYLRRQPGIQWHLIAWAAYVALGVAMFRRLFSGNVLDVSLIGVGGIPFALAIHLVSLIAIQRRHSHYDALLRPHPVPLPCGASEEVY